MPKEKFPEYDEMKEAVSRRRFIQMGQELGLSSVAIAAILGMSQAPPAKAVTNAVANGVIGLYDYFLTKVGKDFTAFNSAWNPLPTSGVDAQPVINGAMNQLLVDDNRTGKLVWDHSVGTFDLNSLVLDANASTADYRYSQNGAIPFYYAVGIPIGSLQRDITLEGIAVDDASYQHGSNFVNDIPTGGVILNVTEQAIDSVPAGSNIALLHHLMPSDTTNFGNSVHLGRLRFRFPTNQLDAYASVPAGLAHCDMEFVQDLQRSWLYAEFEISPDDLQPMTVPAGGLPNVGFIDMQSEHHLQTVGRSQATGCYLGFDYAGEAIVSEQDVANLCTYPFWTNTKYPANYTTTLRDFYEYLCINGPVFGYNNLADLSLPGYELEYATSGPFEKVSAATELQPGSWCGVNGTYKPVSDGYRFIEFWEDGHGGYVSMLDPEQTPDNFVTDTTLNRSNLFSSIDASDNDVTVTLPHASDVGLSGPFVVVRIDNSPYTVVVQPATGDTIEGSTAPKILPSGYSKFIGQTRGTTDWYNVSTGGV